MLPDGLLLLTPKAGLGGPRWMGFGLPPRIAETDECGERAFFWMAEVMEMHSEMTKETGSTATETGRLLYCIRGAMLRFSKVATPEGRGLSVVAEFCTSWLMIYSVWRLKSNVRISMRIV
jgi:hypothetical protein